MRARRSRWVELVDTRSDGEEVLFPFRIRAEIRKHRVRVRCYIKAGQRWDLHTSWPWQIHSHGPHVDPLELDRLAIKSADTFVGGRWENERTEYMTILEKSEVVTGWDTDPYYDNGEDLVPLAA